MTEFSFLSKPVLLTRMAP